MKPSILFVVLLSSLASSAKAKDKLPPSADATQAAFDKFVQAAAQTNWPAECDARQELISLGEGVVPKLTQAAREHHEPRVRRSCYQVLTDSFAKDERTIDALFQFGLRDQDAGIRYHCGFLLGDFKAQRAEQALQDAFEKATGKDEEFLRFTLAKSLAQLGKADALRTLFFAVSDDGYMARYVGNIGLKALSGKNLEDFEGYHYSEGAYVSGGLEYTFPFDALTSAERKAGRFRAATAYFKWLKQERPELYRFVTYTRRDHARPRRVGESGGAVQ